MKKIEQIALRYLCTTITLWSQFSQHNVIVTSYDVICKDSDYLRQLFWNYCVLNKGHIIKNSKSKRTVALTATEGTVSPHSEWNANTGFLGTERQLDLGGSMHEEAGATFHSFESWLDAEARVLAMEVLHKQVMPFLLRRTKDEVLSDLP
ncbi:hypothetical protein BC332_20733 [Capsicum chinense]|nr:hypothetical protein BC332_20733 [Capsicum chinense]